MFDAVNLQNMTSLRYHHIGAINDLFHNYNEWAKSQNDLSQVKISDLWKQPNIADQLLEYWMAESNFMFETITRLKKR